MFNIGVAFRCGIISGVLFHVNLECTLGVVLTFAFVVGVEEVCVLFSCRVSRFSVAVSSIFASCSNAYPCLPASSFGSFSIRFIALVRDTAMRKALSIGVSCGDFTWLG